MTTDTDLALEWHLEHNHYPPVTTEMIPYCKQAIRLAAQKLDHVIVTIEGDRKTVDLPAWQIVDDLHLHDFVETEQEEYLNDL